MSWSALWTSVPGEYHVEAGLPCGDSVAVQLANGAILGAVADGAGSSRSGEAGSAAAVEAALHFLSSNSDYLTDAPFAEAEDRLRECATHVHRRLLKLAEAERAPICDFATTLVAFVGTVDRIAGIQVGDGFIVVGSSSGAYRLLFEPDHGEFLNETSFVTCQSSAANARVYVGAWDRPFVCASTDGLESVAITRSSWTPYARFFQPLEEYLRSEADPCVEEIRSFLVSDRLKRRTRDDRAVAICAFVDPASQ